MERLEDLDEYGWLSKQDDCPHVHCECNAHECNLFHGCYIRVVEEARQCKKDV